jgi:hypothetical protein
MTQTKVNYVNNADLLTEIHKSKSSYCSFLKPEYHQYDTIVRDLDDITESAIENAIHTYARRLTLQEYDRRKKQNPEIKIKLSDCEYDKSLITKSDLIFRVMTFDHVPANNERKKNPKITADNHDRVNFPPFQHWKYNEHDQLICVGKSHWKGDLELGEFSINHGQTTDKLARMYMKMCDRYSTRGNVRSYSYVDEMRNQSLLQLVKIGLQFDESKSDNPFSYFSTVIGNGFCRVLNVEKRNQVIRDELLEIHGLNPSFSRIADYEHDNSMNRERIYQDTHHE